MIYLLVFLGLIVLYFLGPLLVRLLILIYQFPKFIFYAVKDYINHCKNGKEFREYGLTLYCGRQGAGKTTALVDYLERMKKLYPKCLIITNFDYKYQNFAFEDWDDIFKYQNGNDGIIFAIDEVHSEFSSNDWSLFPDDLLRQITQQRKQRIKIIGSSQVFKRVVVQLREQTYQVVDCTTFLGRWTFLKCFDAEDYNCAIDNTEKKMKLKRLWRRCFVQTDYLRSLFDTYKKIDQMKNRYKEKKKKVA